MGITCKYRYKQAKFQLKLKNTFYLIGILMFRAICFSTRCVKANLHCQVFFTQLC